MQKFKKVFQKLFKFRSSKYYVLAIFFISAIYFLLELFLNEPKEFTDSKYKLFVIEESIRSNDNQGLCRIPEMQVHSPEMMKFLENVPPIKCTNNPDWVSCEGSKCSVKKSIADRYKSKITCDYSEILRSTDYKYTFSKATRTTEDYYLLNSDFAEVSCWDDSWNSKWSGVVYGLASLKINDITDSYIRNTQKSSQKLNVLMYGFDSLSKNAFIRKLPNAYDFITTTLKGDVLHGYNIVGDGTPQALIPLLTGFTELELPETRRRMSGSTSVNIYPMIWNSYKEHGYATAFNEDVPNIGTFTYRLNGFSSQPTDHYMRTYYLAIDSKLSSYEKLCVGDTPRHKVMLDYTEQFMSRYEIPKFVFSFHGELSHDSINLVGVADDDITKWLNKLLTSGILNNTILIMMSDHGNRFAKVRDTLQGKLEERLPFFSFTFPEWFKLKYKKQYQNFQQNKYRLTTPFDVHATLEDILRIQHSDPASVNTIKKPKRDQRAISLFSEISKDRSCGDAYIEPHWCACLNWHQINDTGHNEIVIAAAKEVIKQINDFTKDTRDLCAVLTLSEIKWAGKLAPNDNLMRFKQNKDVDGFLADLTSHATKVSTEMYQIKFVVKPGNSIFEASVLHDLSKNIFISKMSDISRVNKYGDQASCILENFPEIRKYCYCLDMSH